MQVNRWLVALAIVLVLAAAFAIDPWAYHHIQMAKVYDTDWGRALRSVGYWPLWIALASALWLHDRDWHRAAYIAASVSVAGILGEVLKLVVRRVRPGVYDGAYGFRPWSDHPFSSSGFGMPSSHALVAFSGATALAVLFPRARPIWYALAVGCIITRVLSGAHFVSDVAVGALVGIAVAIWLRRAVHRLDSTG